MRLRTILPLAALLAGLWAATGPGEATAQTVLSEASGPPGPVPATLPTVRLPELRDAQIAVPRPVRAAQAALGMGRQRLALVLAQGTVGPRLVVDSAPRDALAVAAALRRGGFVVMQRNDVSAAELRRSLKEFRSRLQHGGVGFVYVTGLGVQVDGRSLLLAREAALDAAPADAAALGRQLREAAVPLDEMADALIGTADSPRMLVVDAAWKHPALARWPQPGLAEPRLPAGTIALFASALGSTQEVLATAPLPSPPPTDAVELAASPFARTLVAALLTPRTNGPDALRSVRRALADASLGQTQPWLGGDTDAREEFSEASLLDGLVPRTPEEVAREALQRLARLAMRSGAAGVGQPLADAAQAVQAPIAPPAAPALTSPRAPTKPARALPETPGTATSLGSVAGQTAGALSTAASIATTVAGVAATARAAQAAVATTAATTALSATSSVIGNAVALAARGSAGEAPAREAVRQVATAATAPAAAAPVLAAAPAAAPAAAQVAAPATAPGAATPAAAAPPPSPTVPGAGAPPAPGAAAPLPADAAAAQTAAQTAAANGSAAQRAARTALSNAADPAGAEAEVRPPTGPSAPDLRTQRAQGGGERPLYTPRTNPFGYAEGDTFSWQVTDTWKGEVTREYTTAIEEVLNDGGMLVNGQQMRLDAQGRFTKLVHADGAISQFEPAQALWWAKPTAGERRIVKYLEKFQRPQGGAGQTEWKGSARVGRLRKIETPAGEFEVLPVESSGWWYETLADGTRSSGQWSRTAYYAPKLGHPVAIELENADHLGKLLQRERIDLLHAQTGRAAP